MLPTPVFLIFLGPLVSKEPTSHEGDRVLSLGWEDPLEVGQGNPLQYSCLENSHGQRSLVLCSPWGHKESDTTEQLSTAQPMFVFLCLTYF